MGTWNWSEKLMFSVTELQNENQLHHPITLSWKNLHKIVRKGK